jgi:hypothetical protein
MIGDDDLDAIFASGDFDEEAVFTIVVSPLSTLTIRGWFTDGSDATLLFGNVEIEASKPSLICKTADIATVRNKMSVSIRSTDYTVERVENNGTGLTVVYLKT